MEVNMNDNNEKRDEFICKEVLRVLNAMKHQDLSVSQNANKEVIFDRINEKIRAESRLDIKSNKRVFLFSYLKIASVAAFLLVAIGMAYYIGHHTGKELVSQVYTKTTTPLGVTSRITLADGTAVILNGGSTLSYPTYFSDKERCVTLQGEGFFDVTKDAERPFIVNSNKLSIKVLGTRFGFKAYQDDINTIVTLEEGSVKAAPLDRPEQNGIILEPDQQLVLNNHTGEFQCRNVNTEEYISWTTGSLYFRDNTLVEISKILERKFNINIRIVSEELKNDRYFAHFSKEENIEQILGLLSCKRHWKYENKGGTIEIKTK